LDSDCVRHFPSFEMGITIVFIGLFQASKSVLSRRH
jgi:hypothetical protein